jgi:hypothetical protein
VAAGKRNRSLRKSLSAEGKRRLREAALKHKPWTRSTGPRTSKGKAKSAQNGRWRQADDQSIREIKRELSDVAELIEQMRTIKEHAS